MKKIAVKRRRMKGEEVEECEEKVGNNYREKDSNGEEK